LFDAKLKAMDILSSNEAASIGQPGGALSARGASGRKIIEASPS